MSAVAVVATFTTEESRVGELLDLLRTVAVPTRLEEGCDSYVIHQDVKDPARIVMVERWTSLEALAAHRDTPHIAAMGEGLSRPGLLTDRVQVRVLTPLAG